MAPHNLKVVNFDQPNNDSCSDHNSVISRSSSSTDDQPTLRPPARSLHKMNSFKRPSLLRSFSSKSIGRQSSSRNLGSTSSLANAASAVAEELLNDSWDVKEDEQVRSNKVLLRRASSALSSAASSDGGDDEGTEGSLDISSDDQQFRAKTDLEQLLEQLGRNPSPEQLARAAGQRAQEQLGRCLSKDDESFSAVAEYSKKDFIIGSLLGKGSFSDAFEITLITKDDKPRPTAESLNGDADDLDVIFAKLESKFGGVPVSGGSKNIDGKNPAHMRRNSICVGQQARPTISRGGRHDERSETLVMKCLRPQIRNNPEKFLIGVEDLIHETALLASLDHPNIVKLHGRASGDLTDAFHKISCGYFILLDRLKDTLDDRIDRWKKTHQGGSAAPLLSQVKVACQLAEAMSYLHSKNILFRDLKPSNVGFDSTGVLKLFDFGFATLIKSDQEDNQLYDKVGTPRYMAPEVALMEGYGLQADVYSFGILTWEIFSLKKPFAKIKTGKELHNSVFVKGERPKVGKHWSPDIKNTLSNCFVTDASERPSMSFVKTILEASVREMKSVGGGGDNLRKSKMFKRLTWDI